MDSLRALTPEASTTAGQFDLIFASLLAVSLAVAIGITIAALYFIVKYRKGSGAPRARNSLRRLPLEPVWAGSLLLLFAALFIWGAGAYAYFYYLSPPQQAMEIHVVGKQWMWKVEHANGKREIDTLHVPRGRTVKLVMISEDVIHSFFVPAFRIKRDVLPGRYTTLWFEATRTGEFHLFCAEFCGSGHSRMRGTVVVMEPGAFARWLSRGEVHGSLAAAGERRFREYGCSGCHGANATVHAPKLDGLFGRPVQLSDGSTVIADELYIRDSILLPKKQVAAGFPDIMPSFQGQIEERAILELIAYIKSLAGDPPTEDSP